MNKIIKKFMKRINMEYLLKMLHTDLFSYHPYIDKQYAKDIILKAVEQITLKYFESLAIVHMKEDEKLIESLLKLDLNENLIDLHIRITRQGFMHEQLAMHRDAWMDAPIRIKKIKIKLQK